MRIFSGLVPICAATSFLRSPMVSSSLFVRVGGGRRGVGYGQVRALGSLRVPAGCPPWGKRWGGWAFCGVGCVDTHLHLTRIFLPRRSLSTTSIMRAVAYPDGAYRSGRSGPRGWPPPLFVINFPQISTEPIAKRSSQRPDRPLRALATIPSCGPEAPCCSSRCSSGAS